MSEPTGKRVTEAFAFVLTDNDGDESVPGFNDGRAWVAMMGADMERVESLMPVAREMARITNKQIRVLKFSRVEQIGEINP